MNFAELQLEPSLSSSIVQLGYTECTPIQVLSIPPVLEGRDVAGLAQTGTGKTAAFVIPLMDRILKGQIKLESLPEEKRAEIQKRSFHDWRPLNYVLILVPTRELAEQVHENIVKFGQGSGLRGVSIYGGTGYDKQKEGLRNGVEFVVATPGRLIDLYKEHIVDLKQVRAIVFDEADRMFDMGFKDDMKYILSRVPRERQFLVFSATLNFEVLNTAYQFGAEPLEIDVSRDQAKAENVKDEIFHVGNEEKPMYLLSLLRKHNPKQAIIFSNFKFNVEKIARFLTDNGVPAVAISSLLTQAQRNRVMEQFKAENEKNILVATDVAARGLDIKGVDMVINFEMPQDAESYVHRIGRTGRAGTEGTAFSLVSDRDVESLSRVEDYLKHKLPIGWIEDAELVRDAKRMQEDGVYSRPRDGGGGGRSQGGRPPRGGDSRGGPRGGGDRGPRRDGGRSGPRRDYRSGDNRGPGGEARGDRPARTGSGAHASGGPSRQGQGPKRHPRSNSGGASANGNGAPAGKDANFKKTHNKEHAHKRHASKSSQHRKPHPKSPPPAGGVLKKVSGFFKKILG
ncbi:MAG: ATP-dependent helicase [Bdellovibrio sp. CG10_big_fil_rev_8_21_14_0_10_47_8]|nr:MAG: ATP-dependent helicase [Bdellovibrio sp. CG10_big_fil_rev_8_21_14_0_10_47_8]